LFRYGKFEPKRTFDLITAILSEPSFQYQGQRAGGIMLNIWKHPVTEAVRLYVSPKVIKFSLVNSGQPFEPKTVKAWMEESESSWIVKVTVKTEERVPSESIEAIKSAVLEKAGLNGSESWADLLVLAASKDVPAKKTAPNPRKKDTSSPTMARAKESGRLDIASIKMPGDITIEVDHRETTLISELLSKHPNITVNRVSLELADFRIEDREGNELLIERKRCEPTEASPDGKTDFDASVVVDGRLFDQAERLRFKTANSDHQVIPIVLLEGDVHGNSSMLLQQVDGALSYLSVIQRISVLSSYGANHSAYIVAKLASHFVDGLYTPIARHKTKPKALLSQKLFVLESLPGVSSGIAEALLEHFGSVKAVATATEEELAAVKGVGPKRSRELARVLGEL
jgi:ERCC4-type nuclease